jgi:TonB family protein
LQSLQTPQPSTQLTGQRKVRRKRKSKKAERKETRSKRASPYKGKISTQGGEFKYSYYLDIILSRISENWRNPYEGEGGKISAVVYFIIKRNGEIDKIRLEKSSRNYYFDQSALRAVHATKKLPPLPEEFNRGWLGVYFEFEYIQ